MTQDSTTSLLLERQESASPSVTRAAGEPREEIGRIRDLLDSAGKLTGLELSPSRATSLDPQAAYQALTAAEEAVAAGLHRLEAPHSAEAARLVGLSIQLRQMQVYLRDSLLGMFTQRICDVQRALRRLRAAPTLDDLIQRVPSEIHELGFRRSLISQIHKSHWVARAGYVEGNPELAQAMVLAGSEHPCPMSSALVENDMLRARQPILVHNPQTHPRMHRELIDVTGTRSYVAAPLVAGDKTIGFVHADQPSGAAGVAESDRDLLAMFTEGVSYALERSMLRERLQSLRCRIDEHARQVSDTITEFMDSDIEIGAADAAGAPDTQTERPRRTPPLATSEFDESAPVLTRRERQVLRQMAAGDTNARIARTLVVSEGTVKSHVKHILRKLGATHRAEAVSLYYQSVRSS